jgi:hypothetical protein
VNFFFAIALTYLSAQCFAITVIHNKPTSANDEFNISLLSLVLRKADPSVKLEPAAESYADGRAQAELDANHLSVIWGVTSVDMEQRFLPVRYCVFKGLLGYRIFIINKNDQYKFDQIKTLDDLKQFKAGQGVTWADAKILKSSGLPLVTTTKYANLFPMLDGGRFDYFPRGIFEPWSELSTWNKYNFAVEKNIMIHYPSAFYFFVNKNNVKLAELIARGFELSLADNSYDEFFYSSPTIANAIALSNFADRKVISIENPDMPLATPFDRKELWFDPEKAKSLLTKNGTH